MGFSPDSRLVGRVLPSPNHTARRGGYLRPDSLVLHYTGMADGPSALLRLCDPVAEVSSHYVVEEDGTVLQLVPESRRAHHAGRGAWAGETDLNSASVGIEIVNGGHAFGLPPYSDGQVRAVAALCRDVMDRHGIPPERVLAHSDLAPSRKEDPGELFPWAILAQEGVGLWVAPDDSPGAVLRPGATGDTVARLQADLARWGYDLAIDGDLGPATATVLRAFQRRYRPSRIDGAADAGTLSTLARLIAQRRPVGRSGARFSA